ncbi:MAG: sulfotransferase [Leptolyngbya sp. SIO4C1]|nr:sulfotransferase [Leptolyngbya sp. SIO4C1]
MTGRLPTFLIIGVQKAGTTSIYSYLGQHPQVYLSRIKETNFFCQEWEQAAPEVLAKRKHPINTIEDYRQLFAGATDELAIGEASPNCMLYHETAVSRLQRYAPETKLLAILRNPVQRAYSEYLMNLRDAVGTQRRSLIEQLETRADKSHVLLKGKYYQCLKPFIEAFGPDQVSVFLYDDLRRDAIAFMQQVYRSIGVDDTFVPNTSKKAQQARVPKNESLNQLMRTQNPVRSLASAVLKLVPESTRQLLRQRLIDFNSQSKAALPLTDEERQRLQAYYRDDILKLQDLIQRDLSAWLT